MALQIASASCTGDLKPTNDDQCREPLDDETAGLVNPESNPELHNLIPRIVEASPDGGWILEGDMHLLDTAHLASALHTPSISEQHSNNDEIVTNRSTVTCSDNGLDLTWNVDARLQLTYCLGPFTDVALKKYVYRGLRQGLREVERVADVNYILVPTVDEADCVERWQNNEIRFIVRQALICEEDPSVPTGGPTKEELCDCITSGDPGNCDKKRGTGTLPASPNSIFENIAANWFSILTL